MRTLAISWLTVLGLVAPANAEELPRITHYSLDVTLVPASARVHAVATMQVWNTTSETQTELPFILYRLFDVTAASHGGIQPLAFSQRVRKMPHLERHQVNAARVELSRPLLPGDTMTIRLAYEGPFVGATEVWPYMHDRVSESYALLRTDAVAYPLLAAGEDTGVGLNRRFTYDLRVQVPRGMVVASGGRLVGTTRAAELDTYEFRSTTPAWRIDIAAGHYRLLEAPERGLRAYYLGEDATRAQRAIDAGKRSADFYTSIFGPPAGTTELTIIEVPNGWGAQQADGYILQESAAFDDPAEAPKVYHEVGHAWNAIATPKAAGTRYFDEAFASYFQALAVGALEGATALEQELGRWRRSFARSLDRNPAARTVPIAEYAQHGLGGLSYTKGAWSLYVLHRAMGDEAFYRLVRSLLREYGTERPVDFAGFQRLVERNAGRRIRTQRFFDEWIYGSASSELLLQQELTVEDISRRYRR